MRKYLFLMFYCIILTAIGQNRYEYRYWFDCDGSKYQTFISDKSIWKTNIDVTHLSKTIHSLHIQVKDTSDIWTPTFSKTFVNLGVVDSSAMIFEYWFDQDSTSIKQTSIADIIEIDVSQLSDGLHTLSYQIKDVNNLFIASQQSTFLKVPQYIGENNLRCVYFIDGKLHSSKKISPNNGIINLNLDVSIVKPGLHNLTVQLITSSGVATSPYSAIFFMTPLGRNGVKRYEYWINDDVQNKVISEVSPTQETFNLVSLLEINEYPIRSSCFHFSVEDSIPVIYAKNDFNILFFDNNNNILTETKQYIDVNVKEVVDTTKIETIATGNIKMPRPAENQIQWYKFSAEEGEAISIKSSHATTIQIFNPNGEEILSTSGYASISTNDCFASMSGTYYVAVHDVTATNCNYLSIDFIHMDKYVLLNCYPNQTANIGIFYFDLFGNGFHNLSSIELFKDSLIIHPDKYNSISNTKVKGYFNFDEAIPIGNYDLRLIYENDGFTDTIISSSILTINNAIVGDIDISIESGYSMEFLFPVKIKIKNTGNVSYWGIPLNLAYDNIEEIKNLYFDNFRILWDDILESYGYKYSYIIQNIFDSGRSGCLIPMVIPQIGPYEEITLTVKALSYGDNSHRKFNLYVWSGEPWSSWENSIMPFSNSSCRNIADMYDMVGMVDDIADYAGVPLPDGATSAAGIYLGIGETIGSIHIGLEHQRRKAQRDAYGDYFDEISGYLPNYQPIRHPAEIANSVLGLISPFSNSFNENSYQPKSYYNYDPTCQNPTPSPNPIEILRPHDPNDILGYVAESGSYYIGRDVEKVTYMIEFENDSTIATAPAHRILLSDTLDTNVFDINSIVPLKVQIGDKTYDFTSSNNLNVATIDMRPDINAIAQVSMSVDKSGVLSWILESLDPMTVEPTTEAMSGILPVNDAAGSGMGFITFSINLKKGIEDGTEVANMANIIFDTNDPISTPYWINETDYVNPVSRVDSLEIVNDSIINVKLAGFDERSGIWKYDLYYQPGTESDWFLLAEGLTEPTFQYQVYEDVRYGFCAIATDMAGNKEVKTLEAEYVYLNGDITTSIETISFDNLNINDGVLYDLLGRRVLNPTPGIYIRNGKKILIK